MSDWQRPTELPDLRRVGIIALDTETRDDGLRDDRGSGWPWSGGHICGINVAYRADGEIRAHYFPLRHPDTANFDCGQVYGWLKDLIASGVRIVTQNGLYDFGWLRTEAGILMPPSERLEEIGALATMVDENRYQYSLAALCEWRGLPGKDESSLKEGAAALGFPKKAKLATLIWQLPARFVGPYAEADAHNTLALFESLNPILDQEGTRNAYRLECDLLPMCLEMRRRGIRINTAAAEQARDLLLSKRDAAFAEISEKLGANIGMAEIGRTKWLAETFDQQGIKYPRTEKGNPSFTAGNGGWMHKHEHWLPQLIVKANKYNNAATKFVETYILEHVVNGRVHAEIHPHRSDDGGTRSLRFSYSSPPLQQTPAHDEELAPLIRGVFLPEEGEWWAKPDISQQEFRFIVHYAARHGLRGAKEAVERYRNDPNTDFHAHVSSMTGRDRQISKATNFAKAFGAGVRKFAAMIGKSISEAEAIYAQYDRELPFVSELSVLCERAVRRKGYLTLCDGARRHWTNYAPGGKWQKGLGPCPREEAEERIRDPDHPWHGKQLWLTDTRKAMNALIQGSAARHTKLWMRACWCEGICPLLQMHDALDCSVSSPEQAERVAQLGREAVQLEVPMQVDLAYGRSWGEAKHTWEERHATTTISMPTGPQSVTTEMPQDEDLPDDGDENEGNDVQQQLPPWREELEQMFAPAEAAFAATPKPPPSSPQQEDPQPRAEEPSPRSGNGRFSGDGYSSGEAPKGSPSATYIYRDEADRFFMKVVRTTGKAFPTYHWKEGVWVKGWPTQVLPYRLPELITAPANEPVWITEGEKDADNVAALGLITTTNPGGAKNWQPELAQWFKGKELVYILEDNDEDGRRHTAKIIAALRDIVPTIAVISFPELEEKQDVSDWLAQGGNKQLLLARAEQARKRSSGRAYTTTNLATSPKRAYKWLWPGHLVRGNLELLAGIPGIGKSQIHCQYIAHATTNRRWPNGAPGIEPCRVVMLTAEDNTADTLVPRLEAAGANLSLVEELKWVRRNNRDELFLLAEDLDKLEQLIRDFGDIGLITIDPITAYMGSNKHFDSHRATDVRSQLSPLKLLAERTGVAFSAVTHPPKNASQRAIDHFIGSQAFIAAARIGHACVPEMESDPAGNKRETGRLLFTNPKPLAAKQPTLAYRIGVVEVGSDPETGTTITAPVIRWEGEVEISADEALAATRTTKGSRGSAQDFLLTILANRPALQTLIMDRGAECGFSVDQLQRAKRALAIKSIKKRGEGLDSPWLWALPEDVPPEDVPPEGGSEAE